MHRDSHFVTYEEYAPHAHPSIPTQLLKCFEYSTLIPQPLICKIVMELVLNTDIFKVENMTILNHGTP